MSRRPLPLYQSLSLPHASLSLLAAALLAACSSGEQAEAPKTASAAPAGAASAAPAKPALVVTTVRASERNIERSFGANGNVAAWQEASIGAEAGDLRISAIHVNVGSPVKRGQLLAELDSEQPRAAQAQAAASLAEAEAAFTDAHANAERARQASASSALSAQQISQYLTAEATAQARVAAARASLQSAELRLRHTRVLASDDGIISLRAANASVGAVVPIGQELFRLIRQQRLEWRAEVPSAELDRIHAGQTVQITAPGGRQIKATVRTQSPAVDPQTRNGTVYVDLPADATQGSNAPFKAGMYARGEFQLGSGPALTLPRQAVAMRDGFSYVFALGTDLHVRQLRIEVGRRDQDWVEVRSGLPAGTEVVASGAGFLNDGDLVRIAPAAAPATPAK
ncbi:efflux RND transporter periplasmic adaptor subunit [Zoogloea sp.]|uniref:efflux RND transporter periplasmic adaptor subunit n=1 Tax=Zoogloea sp. TaxID=49181 RepID=UPI0035B0C93A